MTSSRLPSSSAKGRLLKLGLMTGSVGSRYVAGRIRGAVAGAEAKARNLAETHTRNALKLAATLGELKGAAMKMGQMLSAHEDLLPAEMREAIRGLQRRAPPVSFDCMRSVIEEELGAELGQLKDIEPEAYASASIGQVHRARLLDGTAVVVKVQYPNIDRMIAADLKNVRLLAKSLSMVTPMKADLSALATEVAERLMEELDYRQEADHMVKFRELYAEEPEFLIPRPVLELCRQRVLVSEFVQGRSFDEVTTSGMPQEELNRLGSLLMGSLMRQVFEFGLIHADPNPGNFAFTEDGRIVLYDFGCVKRLDANFREALRQLSLDGWQARYDRIIEDLEILGYADRGKHRMSVDVHRVYADTLFGQWREPGIFDFGASTLRQELLELDREHWHKVFDFEVPKEMIFVGRTVGGMFGNLTKLRAQIPMYALLEKHVRTGSS